MTERPNKITDLMVAASKGDTDKVSSLVTSEADVDAKDAFGNTALIYAAMGGHDSVVLALLNCGADPNAQNQVGTTAAQAAAAMGHKQVAELLAQPHLAHVLRDHNIQSPLIVATIQGEVETIRELLAGGADVDAVNDTGWTALRFAVSMGDGMVAKILLEHGADPNVRDGDGWTPLMQASEENNLELVNLFLTHGAQRDARNAAGETALTIAARRGHTSCAALLRLSPQLPYPEKNSV